MAETTYTLPNSAISGDNDDESPNKSMMMTKLEIYPDDLETFNTSPSQQIDASDQEPMINTDSENDDNTNYTKSSLITIPTSSFKRFMVCLDSKYPEIKSLKEQKETTISMQKSDRQLSLLFLFLSISGLIFGILVCSNVVQFARAKNGLLIGIIAIIAAVLFLFAALFYFNRSRDKNASHYGHDIYKSVLYQTPSKISYIFSTP